MEMAKFMDDEQISKMAHQLVIVILKDYDDDGNKQFSKEEFKPLLMSIFAAWREKVPEDFPAGFELDDETLDLAFTDYDKDGNGSIEL